jgi:hypothetical protein
MSIISAVIQKPEETPADFYGRLCETFQIYSLQPGSTRKPANGQYGIRDSIIC